MLDNLPVKNYFHFALATYLYFHLCSSTPRQDRYDIIEILFKVALNTITLFLRKITNLYRQLH
jgi:hypothetical protein